MSETVARAAGCHPNWRVLTAAVFAVSGPVQDAFHAPSEAGGRLGLRRPDRLQDLQHVGGRHRRYVQFAYGWECISFQGGQPLLRMLPGLPARGLCGHIGTRARFEGRGFPANVQRGRGGGGCGRVRGRRLDLHDCRRARRERPALLPGPVSGDRQRDLTLRRIPA